jgi:diacylglycerol kinase (ATP)
MRNQPKYNFIKNTTYALEGLLAMLKTETSFKIEIILFCFLVPIIFYVDTNTVSKILMFSSLMLVLIAETINSAIESVVDLVTTDYHIMAKRAKDIGSFIVFLSITTAIVVWGIILGTNL